MFHVAAQCLVVVAPHAEFEGRHKGRRGHGAEAVVGHSHHVDHHRDAAARPYISRCAAAGHVDQRALDGACQQNRVLGHARAQAATGTAQEQHAAQRRLAVLADAIDDDAHLGRHGVLDRVQRIVQHIPLRVLAGGRRHQQTQAGFCNTDLPAFDDRQRIVDVGAAPAVARIGNLEVTARCRLATPHLDAGLRHVEAAPGLVFGQHAGDVIVDHHHFIRHAGELAREDADRRRAAADAHALLLDAVDDGRPARLDHQAGPAVDDAFGRLFVAQQLHQLDRHAAFFLAAAGEVVHAAERQHLRTVLGRCDVADHLALVAHIGLLGAQEAVGVDLHLETAVTEDALGDHRNHVDATRFRGDDERRRLVVRVRRRGADAGDEHLIGQQQVAIPVGFSRDPGIPVRCIGPLGAGPIEGHQRCRARCAARHGAA